jgi:hypothetical protein
MVVSCLYERFLKINPAVAFSYGGLKKGVFKV